MAENVYILVYPAGECVLHYLDELQDTEPSTSSGILLRSRCHLTRIRLYILKEVSQRLVLSVLKMNKSSKPQHTKWFTDRCDMSDYRAGKGEV